MPRSLKLYITGVVSSQRYCARGRDFCVSRRSPHRVRRHRTRSRRRARNSRSWLGVAFWTFLTLVASALPVSCRAAPSRRSRWRRSWRRWRWAAAVGGWLPLIGSTEVRELRGRIPWYGTLANHAGLVLPASLAGVVRWSSEADPAARDVIVEIHGDDGRCGVFFVLNVACAGLCRAPDGPDNSRSSRWRHPRDRLQQLGARATWLAHGRSSTRSSGGRRCCSPCRSIRLGRIPPVRRDARDVHADDRGPGRGRRQARSVHARHSQNVKQIAVDIGREMRVSDTELEALEWGGLLHDVGKIGVPDAVLLKPDRLTREERMIMNSHPVLGAQIIAPVTKLPPELPIIRHHHEWYNGSGYPDRLIGDEIPKLARILHVADAFEAMTAARPYRMTPLTAEQALGELRKFAGIQFDPAVVDAFVRTPRVDGVSDPGRPEEPRQIPLIAQAANRMACRRIASPRRRPRGRRPARRRPHRGPTRAALGAPPLHAPDQATTPHLDAHAMTRPIQPCRARADRRDRARARPRPARGRPHRQPRLRPAAPDRSSLLAVFLRFGTEYLLISGGSEAHRRAAGFRSSSRRSECSSSALWV